MRAVRSKLDVCVEKICLQFGQFQKIESWLPAMCAIIN